MFGKKGEVQVQAGISESQMSDLKHHMTMCALSVAASLGRKMFFCHTCMVPQTTAETMCELCRSKLVRALDAKEQAAAGGKA